MRAVIALVLCSAVVAAQGAGSCGVHLDVIADGTSTHAAIGDIPGGPGDGGAFTPGDPGNPYAAWATPGSVVTLRLSVPAGMLGGAAFGSGGAVSIFWSLGSLGATNIPFGVPFFGIQPCQSANPWQISVLPIGGAFIDGAGFTGPPPFFVPVDPGWPDTIEFSVVMPAFLTPPDFAVAQALIVTPGGYYAVSNGVSVIGYPFNPNETSLIPSLTASCGFQPTDEGWAPVATPPGFQFYAVPESNVNVTPNGYIDVVAFPLPSTCDYASGAGGIGCSAGDPNARPRIAVNHFDADLLTSGGDLTVETVPAGASCPSRVILRWKHVSPWYDGSQWSSHVCEIWGNDGSPLHPELGSAIVVVRQDIEHGMGSTTDAFFGVGPGDGSIGGLGPPSQCSQVDLPGFYGGSAYGGGPSEAIILVQNGDIASSLKYLNSVVVFEPAPIGLPGGYNVLMY